MLDTVISSFSTLATGLSGDAKFSGAAIIGSSIYFAPHNAAKPGLLSIIAPTSSPSLLAPSPPPPVSPPLTPPFAPWRTSLQPKLWLQAESIGGSVGDIVSSWTDEGAGLTFTKPVRNPPARQLRTPHGEQQLSPVCHRIRIAESLPRDPLRACRRAPVTRRPPSASSPTASAQRTARWCLAVRARIRSHA